MSEPSETGLRLASLRPLVRYVDEAQAVIDAHITLLPPLPTPRTADAPPSAVEVLLEIHGPDGSIDEHRARVELSGCGGFVRFDVVHPQRWWPAGMGEQALYRFTLSLLTGGEVADRRTTTLGLTSVRPAAEAARAAELLVNGRVCDIQSVVAVDEVHERRLLPVGAHMLLLVRGHYGPDVLYDSADRAGLLLIQCVPIDPQGRPESQMVSEVERLAAHPSLVGWFVGHLGDMRQEAATFIRRLDPTRSVFMDLPHAG